MKKKKDYAHHFKKSLKREGAVAATLLIIALGIGVLGYHLTEGLSPLDSLLNASMILGGMGPVNPIVTDGGKLFASFYSLFSGVVFLVVAGIMFGPIAHRVLHRFHADDSDCESADSK